MMTAPTPADHSEGNPMPQLFKASPLLLTASVLCGLSFLAWAPASPADSARHITFLPESKIWLEGTSTLHPYQSTAKKWDISAAFSEDKGAPRVSELLVTIPVFDLKSGDGALDGNLYKALDAKHYPTIRFTSSDCQVHIANGAVSAQAIGRFDIAGKSQVSTVAATGTRTDGTLHLTGSKALLMTDFGVTPPVLLFGAIRCGNQIVVHFNLVGKIAQ
jgi:polyisoprenoid-binding protein YceI